MTCFLHQACPRVETFTVWVFPDLFNMLEKIFQSNDNDDDDDDDDDDYFAWMIRFFVQT